MLRDLHVRNLAVIAEAEVRLDRGLNVVSGETGAGKSIVVDSLALLSGARASGDLIRTGADTLSVSGVFEPLGEGWRRVLNAAGIETSEDEVVVRREVNRQGRNRVFVNDRPVTLQLLSTVAPYLLRIHTQREELGLVSAELQRLWLDRVGGGAAEDRLAETASCFADYRRRAARLARVEGDDRLRQERIDLLRFQSQEIDGARPEAGEDEALRAERDVLRHAEAITEALGSSYGQLFDSEDSAVERMSQAARRLRDIGDWEPTGRVWAAELERLMVGLEDLTREVRDRLAAVEVDPARLDAVEERLSVLDRLCRKYGGDCREVLRVRQRIGDELADLTADASQRQELAAQVDEALTAYEGAASRLSEARAEWAVVLARRVHAELADLAMEKARFAVELTTRRQDDSPLRVGGEPVAFASGGWDWVSYQLAANPGEDLAPLAKSASGGELSRIYLAVQLAVRGSGPAAGATLVFDEVDAGIGGAQAEALGEKLARLAVDGQILVVTHLPQVASHADRHLRVEKSVRRGRTETRVSTLDGAARIEEVARMLGGRQVTDLSRSHAEEMITAAAGRRG